MHKWARGGVTLARVAIGAALMLSWPRGIRGLSHSHAPHPTRCWADGIWSYSAAHRRRRRGSRLERSGTATLVGQFVGSGGSARPIAKVEFTDGQFLFAIPPQWESNPRDITFEGRLDGDRITGSMTMGDGQKATWSGTRAPSLRRAGRPAWGEPVTLFNGKSLDGWQPVGRRDSKWSAVGAILQNADSGANLVTVQKFDDFRLHLEFRVPKGADSGVVPAGPLRAPDRRRRRARAIVTSSRRALWLHRAERERGQGRRRVAIDGCHARGPDAHLRAERHVLIRNCEIPGITGGALDSAEAEAGPLLLQGDHGPVDYRNIVITPATMAR